MQVQQNHPLVTSQDFGSVDDYIIYLMHSKDYETAASMCSGRTILDWGCNNGYGMAVLEGTCARVAGLDTNQTCIDEARRRYPHLAEQIRLFDGVNSPFSGESWEAVVSFQVIEHVPDVNRYIRDIRSALTTDGIAIFATPNREIRLDPGMKPWNEFHVTEYTADDLRQILQAHFRHVSVFGLQGDIEVIGRERSRCAKAKAAAKRGIIERILRKVGRILRRASLFSKSVEQPVAEDVKSFMTRWSTRNLHYDDAALHDSVNLLAVCSDAPIDPRSLDAIMVRS